MSDIANSLISNEACLPDRRSALMSEGEIFGNQIVSRIEKHRSRLSDILMVAVSAFICDAEVRTKVEEFDECNQVHFNGFLKNFARFWCRESQIGLQRV